MAYIVRFQKLGSDIVRKGESTRNPSYIAKLLGERGYAIIHMFEKLDGSIIVPITRGKK